MSQLSELVQSFFNFQCQNSHLYRLVGNEISLKGSIQRLQTGHIFATPVRPKLGPEAQPAQPKSWTSNSQFSPPQSIFSDLRALFRFRSFSRRFDEKAFQCNPYGVT
jgi:hypothetical protein